VQPLDKEVQERRAAVITAARAEASEFEDNPAAQADFELWEGTLEDGLGTDEDTPDASVT